MLFVKVVIFLGVLERRATAMDAPNEQPIVILDSTGVTLQGTMILEAGYTYAPVGVRNASDCRLQPTLKNRAVMGQAALQIVNVCVASMLRPVVMGKATAFSFGTQVVGTADARNEYNLSGIDSACIAGGATNKLLRDMQTITQVGLSGSNMVTGVVRQSPFEAITYTGELGMKVAPAVPACFHTYEIFGGAEFFTQQQKAIRFVNWLTSAIF